MKNTKTLEEALLEARKKFKPVIKKSDNPYFKSKYAELGEILDAVIPALNEQGILLTQPVSFDAVFSRLSKGEEKLESCLALPEIEDPQKIGSAITYYRRYTLLSLLALAAEDDDANSVSGKNAPKEQPKQEKKTVKKPDSKTYKVKSKQVETPEGVGEFSYDLESMYQNDPEKYAKAMDYIESIVDTHSVELDDVNSFIIHTKKRVNKLKNYLVDDKEQA